MRSVVFPFVFILSASIAVLFAQPAISEEAISSSTTELAGDVLSAPVGNSTGNIDIGVEPRPIPESRLNVRRVGPQFYPDPSRALDFRRDI